MKLKIFLSIIWAIIWWFLTEFVFMPTYGASASGGMYLNITIFFGVLAVICYNWEDASFSPVSSISAVISGVSLLLLIIIWLSNTTIFTAKDHQKLIGDIKQTEFTSNVQPISPNQMLIVDEEIAKRIGEKELGSDPGLGSRCTLGKFTLQAVKGQLYWIAALEHSGFWKWNRFKREGTPGYIYVSATNQEDYHLVEKLGDTAIHIKYQPSAFFGQDLARYIYTHGYRSSLFGDFMFEVDEQWHPYWTVTLYESKIGFSGKDATGVLTVNPETGEIKEYTIEEAPAWIDRIQPQDFVSKQVDMWGKFVHGWWNWSHRDVTRVASESSLVLGSDGRAYYYFGLTSSGTDNSTVGFVMVDTRTKKAHWFKQSGATETAAKGSAEGKVQEKGYVGSDGVTYNIDGHPTYEFLLKDKAGLMKLISLVNVHDHNIVGVGENRYEAIQDYRTQMTNRGNSVSIATSDMEQVTITSKVKRFAPVIVKGSSHYYLTIEEKPNMIFSAGPTVSNELFLTKEGDPVKIQYLADNSAQQEIPLNKFDNLSLGVLKDSIQITNETRLDSIKTIKVNDNSNKIINQQWDSLSPEQKRKLLKSNKH